jgi:hypothetical protein
MHTKFWLESLKGTDNLEDLSVDEKILLKPILKRKVGGCGLDSFDQDRYQWQALVNTIINLSVP